MPALGFKPMIEMLLLCNWKCFSNSARSRWLLRGHMISNNKTVFPPKSLSGQDWKMYDVSGLRCYTRMLTYDRRLQRGLTNFQLSLSANVKRFSFVEVE